MGVFVPLAGVDIALASHAYSYLLLSKDKHSVARFYV